MNSKEIGERLIKLRGKKKQADVAKAIGVSQSTYSLYESGQRIPSDTVKIRIAEYFNRTVQTIFFK